MPNSVRNARLKFRDIAKATIEGDIQHIPRSGEKSHRRVTQPRAKRVLMRGHAGHAFECAQKVVWAQVSVAAPICPSVCAVGRMALDLSYRHDAGFSIEWRRLAPPGTGACGEIEGPANANAIASSSHGTFCGSRAPDHCTSQPAVTTPAAEADAKTVKPSARSVHSCIGGQPLEVVRLVPEGHAAVTLTVLVAAFEAVPLIAEHQRAGGHDRAAGRGSVAERACHHDSNGVARMLLFERPVLRP